MKTDNELIAEFMEPRYNLSWDLLMPVCSKILSRGYPEDGFVFVGEMRNAMGMVDIDGTYTAVLKFIKWYNDQKP